MEYIFSAFFILINYMMLYKYSRQLNDKRVRIALICTYLFLLGCGLIIHTWFLNSTLLSPWGTSILFRVYCSIQISIIIWFFNRAMPYLTTRVISFHQLYNTDNLNRQPVKFLIDQQKNIIRVATILIFIFSIMIMYVIWFVES